MKDFPEELSLIFEALSQKDCRQIILELWDGPIDVTKIDRKKVRPLINAGMVGRWTRDFKEHYYEITLLGKAILKAILAVFNPKRKETQK